MTSQFKRRELGCVLILYFLKNILDFSICFKYCYAFKLIGSRDGSNVRILDVLYRNTHFDINSNNQKNDIYDIGDAFFSDISEKCDAFDPFTDNLGKKKCTEGSHRKKVIDNLSTRRVQNLDPPLESKDDGYNCLVHLIGIPYNFSEFIIAKWLEDYGVCTNDVTFLLEFNGSFTGDAYVRCKNREIQKKIIRDKHMNHISDRYIEVYPVLECAYKQYYQAKYFKKLRKGFYTPLETLVPSVSYRTCKKKTINELRCGDLIVGKITKITDKGGVLKPLNIGAVGDNIAFILCNDRLSQNVTFNEDITGDIELKLIWGMEVNLYFEKIKVVDSDTDFWDEKSVILASKNNISNPLTIVYVTMDCTICDRKAKLLEQKLLK
ncbi:conserved Plasmodium protein, unknown function [Babesia microti strain RI]|uniref:RRM domain-containing protein n=1 Tax=Babesia microti (strain RI) TaxID=1133968 RepID=A0A1R4AAA5_BABMR|nr:conserved Plasmodium protein, unknown function [Babesia microti strain RI]SJK85928.1 conserved Plasmodium protein, unknown function [Babesia microti strain RI]|eukprot:XP_021338135.1 conserved Plasmodium protein, unknown function [Babesia microti strain RI]